jgi:hypothetical protein
VIRFEALFIFASTTVGKEMSEDFILPGFPSRLLADTFAQLQIPPRIALLCYVLRAIAYHVALAGNRFEAVASVLPEP